MMLVVMVLTTGSAWAWSGDGSSGNPFLITNASDLAQLATDVNGGKRYANKYFEQTADITALSTMATIGSSNPFCGHYDGGGFTISGLTKPLFGSIQKGETGYQQYTLAEVKDLTISGAEISIFVTGDTKGILANGVNSYVSITNCHVVNSSLTIANGSTDAKCGGLIGSVDNTDTSYPTTISGCSVTATSITNSISDIYCGGLFGVLASRKNVYDNYVEATLTGDNKGAIAGKLTNTTTPSNYQDNYYHAATGLTAIPSQTNNGEAAVCALSGVPSGVTVSPAALLTRDTKNYYAVGNVTLTIDDANKAFLSFSVSGATYSVAANRKSATVTLATSDATVSAELLTISGSCGDNATWTMTDENGDGTYETLTISGTGAMTDYNASDNRAPWKADFSPTTLVLASGITRMAIADEADLRLLSDYVNAGNTTSGKTFVQTADITMTGGDFTLIGNIYAFKGTYDGGGNTISDISISHTHGDIGLFARIDGATVRNVRLVSPSVRATHSDDKSTKLGALIGMCESDIANTVENCVVVSPTLTIDHAGDKKNLGAIIGQILDCNTTVSNCYYYDNAHDYALVGLNDGGNLDNCARARKVTLGDNVTVSPAATDMVNGFVYNNESYYREGLELTFTYGATIPEGQHLVFTLNCKAIDNNTLRMPATDVIVHAAIGTRYHYDNTTGELVLIAGEFSYDNKWGNEVTESQVTSVTATKHVSFTGNCSTLFRNYANCTSIDLSNVNTASVTNMNFMFYGCMGLTSLDLSGWNTASVTNMNCMFYGCTGLTSLDLSGWNTASVTNMNCMFYNCTGLTSLDLSGWNTASVTNMNFMFCNCKNLTSLDLSGWNTASVTNMSTMFNNCTGLTSLDLSGWNTASVTYMNSMFYNCTGLTSLDLSGWNTASVTTMTGMFYNCTGLTSLDLSGWNTASVTTMAGMFQNCTGLTSLDLSGWNTASVTYMSSMFYNCTGLTSLDLSGWNTASVTNMDDMFYNCTGLTSLDLSGWNTASVTDMDDMFYNCKNLTSLDLSGWNTASVTTMTRMFYKCTGLTSLDLTDWNTASVTNMSTMFYGCKNLETIFVGAGWSTTNVTYDSNMFMFCNNLVGGCGTKYNSQHIGKEYARIDSKLERGYFTDGDKSKITLFDNGSNTSTLTSQNHNTVIVTLSGRTLYKDGAWNTLCLPFDATLTGVLAGATLMELDTDAGSYEHVTGLDNGTLYLNFKDATSIEAGKPYIIKWDSGSNIENPVFTGVTIEKNASTEVTFTGGKFKGTYSPIEWDTENKSILFLGSGNTLYWPQPSEGNTPHLNAFRAYFDLGTSQAREFVLNFDDGEATGIKTTNSTNYTNSDAWYDMSGRKLSGKPTQAGLYIVNGHKVVMK